MASGIQITSWDDNSAGYCINGVHVPYRKDRVAAGINQENYGSYAMLIRESLSRLTALDFDNNKPCSINQKIEAAIFSASQISPYLIRVESGINMRISIHSDWKSGL